MTTIAITITKLSVNGSLVRNINEDLGLSHSENLFITARQRSGAKVITWVKSLTNSLLKYNV